MKIDKNQRRNLFYFLAVILAFDLLIADPLPFIDELLLGFFTWKQGVKIF